MRAASGWTLAIDFGTSYTVAAIRIGQRPAEVIEIAGERRVPSVVLADEAGLVVGRVAEELAQAHPERALRTPKSRMGDIAPVLLAGHPYQIVDLVAALLEHIAAEAERYVGSPPSQVRLTHPATWNGLRRTQLVRAATAAGLPEVVLVPEPVAAAISYAQEVGVDLGRHVVVYDLGGGTFDTAVLRSTGAGFEVIGRPTGDLQLGGELFDELVANSIGAQLDPLVWEAIQVSDEPRWQRAASSLRRESRRAKEALSAHPYAELLVALPGGVVQHRVTRVQLDELIRPHVEESVSLLLRCMSDASVSADDIEAVFLAGGGSRSPLVEEALRAALPGVGMSRRGDPKLAVALGACEDSATPPLSVALPPATSAEAAPATTIEPAPPGRQAEPTVADGPPVAAAPTVAAGTTTVGLGVAALPPPVYEAPTAPARPARATGRRRLRPIVASLGGAVLLLGAGVGVLATRSSSTPRTATTTTISAPPTTNPPPPPTTPRPTDPPTTTTSGTRRPDAGGRRRGGAHG